MVKYNTNNDESEVLPNLLNLSTQADIEQSEFQGFLYAALYFSQKLNKRTRFNLKYIADIHKKALGHLYSFAGKYRTVNMSKGGFVFPSVLYLEQSMQQFEKEFLLPLPNQYDNINLLVKDIAAIHAELLFIHPFREGNGRTARLLASLMAQKEGFPPLNFKIITEDKFTGYVQAVQKAADKDYSYMEKIIRMTFVDESGHPLE